MTRTPSSKKTEYQGLPAYLPVIVETHNGKSRRITLPGDPLANPKTARKYAQIEINRLNQQGK